MIRVGLSLCDTENSLDFSVSHPKNIKLTQKGAAKRKKTVNFSVSLICITKRCTVQNNARLFVQVQLVNP